MRVGARPAYIRLLRLRHLKLRPLTTLVLFEGSVCLGLLLAMAEIMRWWAVLVLPAAIAVVVKFNDVIAGVLAHPVPPPPGLAGPVAVGRSPIAPSSRPTVWIEVDDAVPDPDAPSSLAATASPGRPRRPQPGVPAMEPPLPRDESPTLVAEVPDPQAGDGRDWGGAGHVVTSQPR